jgi:alginate O-acetyltransferase complex protein AlgI
MRMLSYLSEIKRDTIARQRRTLESFLAWLFYPPTMIQGPLERFVEFQDALDHCHERRGAGMIAAGVARMALGAGKCLASLLYLHPFVVGQLGLYTHNTYFDHPERIQSYAVLLFGGHAMIFALYLEFSGYCDFAAGMSRLIGYRPIENFRWWLLSTSLVDLWRRWHISLSFMLRDYIFTPLVRRRLTPTLCLLITFLLCGLWHMLISGMLWWGVTMGLAVALNQKWSRWMRDLDRKPHRRLAATRRAWLRLRPLPAVCAWALTIHAFCVIAWFFFGNGGALRVAWELLRRPLAWAGVIAP